MPDRGERRLGIDRVDREVLGGELVGDPGRLGVVRGDHDPAEAFEAVAREV